MRISKRYILILFLFTVNLHVLNCQENNTLYFMHGIPQSNQLNPASPVRCGFYFGMPAMASWEINGGNSALGFNDVYSYRKDIDSMVTFMYDNTSQNKFLKTLNQTNSIYTNVRVDWFSIGARFGKTYWSINAGERIDGSLNVPIDMFQFAMKLNITEVDQNAAPKSFDFSGIGINTTWYRDISLNISKEFSSNFTFGVRLKALFGIANVSTNKSQLYFKDTGIEKWTFENKIEMNMSVPGLGIDNETNTKQGIENLKFKSSNTNLSESFLNFKNRGFGADLGCFYRITPKISLSASIIDLGFIRWTNNVSVLKFNNSFTYKGTPTSFSKTDQDTTNMVSTLSDSLKNFLSYTASKSSYTSYLSTRIYLGGEWQLHERLGLGALVRLQYLNNTIYPQYTASAFILLLNHVYLSTSYTIADHMYDNFGLGLSYRLGFLQFYVLSERIPLFVNKTTSNIPIPAYAKNMNIRFGLNFTFGYNKLKKLLKDKPLVED